MFRTGLVNTLVAHANKEGFGLTPLSPDWLYASSVKTKTKQYSAIPLLVTNKQTNKQINKQIIAIYGCPCKVLSFFLLLESPTPPYWWWGAICIGKAIFTSKLWLCSTQTILRERKFWIFWIAKVNLVASWFYIPSRLPKSSKTFLFLTHSLKRMGSKLDAANRNSYLAQCPAVSWGLQNP